MQTATLLRKGDLVQVMVGRAKGKSGKVLRVDRKYERVYVEKVNMVKRHLKPSRANPQGGVLEKEAPMRWSNVMPVCPKCAKPVRLRHQVTKEVRQRACGKCGALMAATHNV
ncbi:MAG: 50S ribosomal protein L24 [Deltaproteobacteria bacterium]|nr:50S ribosomal protein L24 [Deltaproteobacteria bacterium]